MTFRYIDNAPEYKQQIKLRELHKGANASYLTVLRIFTFSHSFFSYAPQKTVKNASNFIFK